MESSTVSVFVLLQLILAPILYPYGYLIEFMLILLIAYQNRYLREIDLQLLEPLVLVFLLTNTTLGSEEMSATGYAVRILLVLVLCYHSQRLQELSNSLITPMISSLFFFELLAVKQLYPAGYLAQLLLIYFLYFHDKSCSGGGQKGGGGKGKKPTHPNHLNPSRRSHNENPITGLSSSLFFSPSTSESIEEAMVCKICFERFVDTAFSSCGHTCCRDCATSLLSDPKNDQNRNLAETPNNRRCPFCQTPIVQKIDLFFP